MMDDDPAYMDAMAVLFRKLSELKQAGNGTVLSAE
jgi:hypothetical protein